MYKRGYAYESFLSLDNQMKKGSRELLVSFGWLIYHIKFIDKCMKQCLNSILNINEVCEYIVDMSFIYFFVIIDK